MNINDKIKEHECVTYLSGLVRKDRYALMRIMAFIKNQILEEEAQMVAAELIERAKR